jgi:hypothetical protein
MDYFLDENFNYEQYKDKSVLIIGGGPSTREVKWENLNYDYIWTCTDFYLNDRILSKNIDLGTLGNLQDFNHPSLHSMLDTNKNLKILIELDYIYPETFSKNNLFFEKYYNRIHYSKCSDKSYTSFVGPPARLMLLACYLGMKQVYFVGLDGYDKNMKAAHSFKSEYKIREGAVYNTYEMWYNAMTTFTEKIWNDFKDTVEFFNLGEAAESHNIPSFVSKDKFPLKQEIYEKIK